MESDESVGRELISPSFIIIEFGVTHEVDWQEVQEDSKKVHFHPTYNYELTEFATHAETDTCLEMVSQNRLVCD